VLELWSLDCSKGCMEGKKREYEKGGEGKRGRRPAYFSLFFAAYDFGLGLGSVLDL